MIEKDSTKLLIKDTIRHTRDLDREVRSELGLENVSPYGSPLEFIDTANDTYKLIYDQKIESYNQPLRSKFYNFVEKAVGYDATIGANVMVHRIPFETGEKETLHLSRDLGYRSLLDTIGSPITLTNYHASLKMHGRLSPDDPRRNPNSVLDDGYYEKDIKATPEEIEESMLRVIALTPDNLHRATSPELNPEKEKELYAFTKANVRDLFNMHGIDALKGTEERTLTYKVGTDEEYAEASIHYKPFTLSRVGGLDSPVLPKNEGAYFSPTVFISLKHGERELSAVLPMDEQSVLGRRMSLTARGSGQSVRLNGATELQYVASLTEHLTQYADYSIEEATIETIQMYQYEKALRPVVPSSDEVPSLVDFIKKNG